VRPNACTNANATPDRGGGHTYGHAANEHADTNGDVDDLANSLSTAGLAYCDRDGDHCACTNRGGNRHRTCSAHGYTLC
jgi:hypothetical protein